MAIVKLLLESGAYIESKCKVHTYTHNMKCRTYYIFTHASELTIRAFFMMLCIC